MPDFDVTGPDGKLYTLTGPEGSTREDALRMAPKLHAEGRLRLKETDTPAPPEKSLSWSEVPLDAVKGAAKGLATGIETFPGAMASTMKEVGEFVEGIFPETEGMRKSREQRQQFAEENPVPMLSSKLPSPEGAIGKTVESVAAAAPMAAAAPGRAATRTAMAVGGGVGSEVGGAITGGPGGRFIGGIAGGGLAGGAEMGASAFRRGQVNPAPTAIQDFTRAMERDGMTPEQLWNKLEEARKVRPDATVADVAGENMHGIMERIAQTPGAGRHTLIPRITERQEGQLDRLATDLRGLTGTTQTARKAVQRTMAERAENATPLYKTAYEEGDRAVWNPELERLTSSDSVTDAMKMAVRGWRDDAIADGYGSMNPGAMVEGGGLLKFTGGKLPAFPNLQLWDYTKRHLDDMVREARKAGSTNKARRLTKLTAQLRNALDNEVPSYKAARDSWSGDQAYLDAIEEGKKILKRSVTGEETEELLTNMSAAEREGYNIGAVSTIIDSLSGTSAKLGDMTKALRSKEMRRKISNMLSPEAAQSWNQRLNYEIRSSELTGQSLKNSATFRRLAEQQDADSLVGELAMSLVRHNPLKHMGFYKDMLLNLRGRFRGMLRSKADELLAEMITGDPMHAASGLASEAIAPGALAPNRAPINLPGISVSGEQLESRAGGGPVNAGQPYMVGEEGAETFVPDQPGHIVPNEAGEAQGAREAAASRMKRSVQPPEGREEGGLTELMLGLSPPGAIMNAYQDYQQGNYGQAGMDLLSVTPIGKAAKVAGGAIRAAPKAAAAAGGALGAGLFSSSGAESAKLTRAQQQQLEIDQQRIKAQSEATTQQEREKAKGEQEKLRVEAETRKEELRLKAELEQQRIKEADLRRAEEEKKFQEASLREKYPEAATWLSTSGIALSALLPYGIRLQSSFRKGQFFKDWNRTAAELESAVKKGDEAQAKLRVNQLAAFKAQAKAAQEKASQVSNWMVGALTPLELSMLPEQADLMFGSEKAKGKAEEAIFDWRRYPAALLQGGALSALGVKTPVPQFGPNPQATAARSEGAIKTFKKDTKKREKAASLSEMVSDPEEEEFVKRLSAKK